MKIEVDHTELLTILENQNNICSAALLLQAPAEAGDIMAILTTLDRTLQLIQQSVKSTTAIVSQIRERCS